MGLKELVEISRFYGNNPEYVLAGGGNTSYKTERDLFIKASGTALSEIDESGFVRMDRKKLSVIRTRTYSADPDAREAEILSDLMEARAPGEEKKRPSVETPMHHFIPYTYVIHTHPALVNGLTCSQNGERDVRRLLGDDVLWIESVNPGYVLSTVVRDRLDAFNAVHGRYPTVIFLQNHGIVVSSDTPEDIRKLYDSIMEKLRSVLKREPDTTELQADDSRVEAFSGMIREMLSGEEGEVVVRFTRTGETDRFLQTRDTFAPLSSAFTPDHIVYAGDEALFVPHAGERSAQEKELRNSLAGYRQRNSVNPRVIAIQGTGVFAVGDSEQAAARTLSFFLDAVKVAVYAESFGGHLFMPQDQIDFINNWEVERYRKKVSREGQ